MLCDIDIGGRQVGICRRTRKGRGGKGREWTNRLLSASARAPPGRPELEEPIPLSISVQGRRTLRRTARSKTSFERRATYFLRKRERNGVSTMMAGKK